MLAYLIESLYRFAQLLNALTLLVLVPERGWPRGATLTLDLTSEHVRAKNPGSPGSTDG